jgi:Secretion system C-terminal sorting domain
MNMHAVPRLLFVVLIASSAATVCSQDINVKLLDIHSESMVFLTEENRILLSLPAQKGNPPALAFMNPVFGTISERLELDEDPGVMALSDDESVLYLATTTQILRLDLATRQVDLSIPIESDRYVYDIELLPGSNKAVCVLTANSSFRQEELALYVHAAKKPKMVSGISVSSIAFGESSAILYGYSNRISDFAIQVFDINELGIYHNEEYRGIGSGYYQNIEFAKGSIWTDGGRRIDVSSDEPLLQGELQFGPPNSRPVIAPFHDENKMYTYNAEGLLGIHHANTFNPIAYYNIGSYGNPVDMISWSDGINLAITTRTITNLWSLILVDQCEYSGPDLPGYTLDVRFCRGDTIELTANSDSDTYYWNTGEISKTIRVSEYDEYSYRLADEFGCLGPTIETFYASSEDYTSPPSIFRDKYEACYREQIELEAGYYGEGKVKFLWSTGDTSEIITVSGPGQYSLTAMNDIGCQTPPRTITIDTVDAQAPIKPVLEVVGDFVFCPLFLPVIYAPQGFAEYEWKPFISTSDSALVTFSTNVSVRVANDQECWSEPSDALMFELLDVETEEPIIERNGLLLASSIGVGNQWYLNNEAIDGATGQFLQLSETGAYKTIVTQLNCLIGESNVITYMTTSTAETETGLISISPNPTSEGIRIEGDLIINSFELVNSAGQSVMTGNKSRFESPFHLDLSTMSHGIYFLLLKQHDRVVATFKVIRI